MIVRCINLHLRDTFKFCEINVPSSHCYSVRLKTSHHHPELLEIRHVKKKSSRICELHCFKTKDISNVSFVTTCIVGLRMY
jgi:hypothetical protein